MIADLKSGLRCLAGKRVLPAQRYVRLARQLDPLVLAEVAAMVIGRLTRPLRLKWACDGYVGIEDLLERDPTFLYVRVEMTLPT